MARLNDRFGSAPPDFRFAGTGALVARFCDLDFVLSGAAIIPVADWMRRATNQLAKRTGPAIGGLVKVAFGSVAELILALFVLRRGNMEVVNTNALTGRDGPEQMKLHFPELQAEYDAAYAINHNGTIIVVRPALLLAVNQHSVRACNHDPA